MREETKRKLSVKLKGIFKGSKTDAQFENMRLAQQKRYRDNGITVPFKGYREDRHGPREMYRMELPSYFTPDRIIRLQRKLAESVRRNLHT